MEIQRKIRSHIGPTSATFSIVDGYTKGIELVGSKTINGYWNLTIIIICPWCGYSLPLFHNPLSILEKRTNNDLTFHVRLLTCIAWNRGALRYSCNAFHCSTLVTSSSNFRIHTKGREIFFFFCKNRWKKIYTESIEWEEKVCNTYAAIGPNEFLNNKSLKLFRSLGPHAYVQRMHFIGDKRRKRSHTHTHKK